jgi:hypothetical protein
MIAPKDAAFDAGRVRRAREATPGRKGARSGVHHVAEAVAAVALAQEESGNDAQPAREHPVTTRPRGREGTDRLRGEDGGRETEVLFAGRPSAREQGLEDRCHRLKQLSPVSGTAPGPAAVEDAIA